MGRRGDGAARRRRSLIVGIVVASALYAFDEVPPPDLVRRVAHVETETQQARDHYTYRQSVTIEELSDRGMRLGEYREVRDVIFSPGGERAEQMIGSPAMTLKNLKLTDEDWADSFALKFFGAVRVTRASWPHLKKSAGSVLFISGAGGRTPGAEFAAGGAVNAGLLSLTKALAETGIKDGVQVNSVNPGTVRTDRLKTRLDTTMEEQGIDLATAERRFVEGSGVTRIGEPEDIAALVAFVVGPEGRFLQGSLIDMDGGATKTV